MSFDPHHNIFYFYRGPKKDKEHGTIDFQLENNTTKALLNTLYHSDPNVCKDFIYQFLDISIEPSSVNYALQKRTIGSQKIKRKNNRILLGICPQLIFSEEDLDDPDKKISSKLDDQDSIPDAWIWDKDTVILIESKTRMKFDKNQLEKHKKILASPTAEHVIFWEDIHSYFKNKIKNNQYQENPENIFLIKQYNHYLELVNLSKFSGWKKEDFEFFFFYEESEKLRIKNKMEKFTLEILSNKDISDLLEVHNFSKVGKESFNIWCRLDPKDPRFKLSNQDDQFLNFTFELYANHFQVSIVFPLFPSIKKLNKALVKKESTIIRRFKEIFGKEIEANFSHGNLEHIISDKIYNISTIPNYKIRIFDHHFVNIGDRYWFPRVEMTLDAQNLRDARWFKFLKDYMLLYHPKDSQRDSKWGAGLHILKEYPRGSELLEQPEDLINDVQKTLLDFYEFGQSFLI